MSDLGGAPAAGEDKPKEEGVFHASEISYSIRDPHGEAHL